MKKLLLLCICLASTITSNAQTEDKKWNFGLHGGIIQYHGDLGRDWYKTDETMYGFGGISATRFLSKYFDLNLSFSRGTLGYNSGVTGYKSDFSAASLNLRLNLLSSDYYISPYVFGGVGAILFDNQLNFHTEKIDYALPTAGAGINIKLSPVLILNIQEKFLFTDNDQRDGVESGKNDDYVMHSAGLTFNFGDKKDADLDGVSDSNDKCPDTPAGVAVDKKGCPLDKDNDGVADYLDNCPDAAGNALMNGCPDRDNDGVADKDDRCPDVTGTTALKGCPDSDNDGVADMDDKCPNSTPGSKVDQTGCAMDNDKDGVTNDKDKCPDIAGPASLNGCPDTDGDGVADIDDKCPTLKGNIANKGCPEIAKQDAVRITYIGSKLFFENNSDKLKVASLTLLDELTAILNKYEGASLYIDGHTDSVGSDDSNMVLSQKRTNSVRTYLIGKGISESRLTATGFGESKPIATNETSLGRSKNRRVELRTNY
ncbi:OmpA family protein [Flavobacterium dankookense]|uniref:Thrombospondin type 3 repeat-containing protein n=1 Tax=Flavobacterium dankookense TaxID=706186 RepID=A0A4R6QFX6_9FLAO|nr:OmpA family protein [Flavobacterium dankookense]TDP60936.1 thrombospondin type 3 repeat-containing protein [Flavobacterium dankookense]